MTTLTLQQPYQTVFTIRSNHEELIPLLQLKYGRYIIKSESKSSLTIIAVKSGESFAVSFGDKTWQTDYPLLEIDRIIFENNQYNDRIFAMHGAAVEHGGKASLFLASTTSGKTTLTSYLTSNGFGYITDDCILLERTTFHIHPFCTPIHLRTGGVQVLEKYNICPENLVHLDDPVMERYVYTPENCVTTPLPLDKIFFISRTEHENQLISMNSTERMSELMKSPITDYPVNGDYLRFLAKLAQTDCYKLRYSDMEFVVEVLRGG